MNAAPPESKRQAARWMAVKANAEHFGLCTKCVSQFAWGCSSGGGGFSTVHRPCDGCRRLLAALPAKRANGWRTVVGQGGAANPANWPTAAILSTSEGFHGYASDPAPVRRSVPRN